MYCRFTIQAVCPGYKQTIYNQTIYFSTMIYHTI